jgi:hypothetical protein
LAVTDEILADRDTARFLDLAFLTLRLLLHAVLKPSEP